MSSIKVHNPNFINRCGEILFPGPGARPGPGPGPGRFHFCGRRGDVGNLCYTLTMYYSANCCLYFCRCLTLFFFKPYEISPRTSPTLSGLTALGGEYLLFISVRNRVSTATMHRRANPLCHAKQTNRHHPYLMHFPMNTI